MKKVTGLIALCAAMFLVVAPSWADGFRQKNPPSVTKNVEQGEPKKAPRRHARSNCQARGMRKDVYGTGKCQPVGRD